MDELQLGNSFQTFVNMDDVWMGLSLKLSLVMDDYPLDKDLHLIYYGHQMIYQFMSPMTINPSGH
jgi:hypothetical protein